MLKPFPFSADRVFTEVISSNEKAGKETTARQEMHFKDHVDCVTDEGELVS